jgi:hypothetical protein
MLSGGEGRQRFKFYNSEHIIDLRRIAYNYIELISVTISYYHRLSHQLKISAFKLDTETETYKPICWYIHKKGLLYSFTKEFYKNLFSPIVFSHINNWYGSRFVLRNEKIYKLYDEFVWSRNRPGCTCM